MKNNIETIQSAGRISRQNCMTCLNCQLTKLNVDRAGPTSITVTMACVYGYIGKFCKNIELARLVGGQVPIAETIHSCQSLSF